MSILDGVKKGAGLLGRPAENVSVNIVNWEGNYIKPRHNYYRLLFKKI